MIIFAEGSGEGARKKQRKRHEQKKHNGVVDGRGRDADGMS